MEHLANTVRTASKSTIAGRFKDETKAEKAVEDLKVSAFSNNEVGRKDEATKIKLAKARSQALCEAVKSPGALCIGDGVGLCPIQLITSTAS